MKRITPFIIISVFLFGIITAQNLPQNDTHSFRELIVRSDAGDARAMFQLARIYDTGYDSLPVDSAKSTSLYLKSANKGYAPAQNYIGFRYYKGEYLKQNIDSALYWIRLAAEAGDITAAANLGYLYVDSPLMEHNEDEAAKWLEIAAEGGVGGAELKLIEIMGSKWRELQSDSALKTGIRYYSSKAKIAGAILIEIASEYDHPKALALMGDAYSKGMGTVYDYQKSVDYFFQAAIKGDPSAQFIVAELLDFFPDTSPSFFITEEQKDPRFWYEKAAQGNVRDSETAFSRLLTYP